MTDPLLPPLSGGEKRRRLGKALRFARLSYADMIARCSRGQSQFHDTPRACGLTSIAVSREGNTCHIEAVAGAMDGIPELEAQIEAWARSMGCDRIEMNGRPGWTRTAAPARHGYRPVAVVWRKELSYGRAEDSGGYDADPED